MYVTKGKGSYTDPVPIYAMVGEVVRKTPAVGLSTRLPAFSRCHSVNGWSIFCGGPELETRQGFRCWDHLFDDPHAFIGSPLTMTRATLCRSSLKKTHQNHAASTCTCQVDIVNADAAQRATGDGQPHAALYFLLRCTI